MAKVCDGFFEDPRHLEEQFKHLTESSISDKIRKGLVGHLGPNCIPFIRQFL